MKVGDVVSLGLFVVGVGLIVLSFSDRTWIKAATLAWVASP